MASRECPRIPGCSRCLCRSLAAPGLRAELPEIPSTRAEIPLIRLPEPFPAPRVLELIALTFLGTTAKLEVSAPHWAWLENEFLCVFVHQAVPKMHPGHGPNPAGRAVGWLSRIVVIPRFFWWQFTMRTQKTSELVDNVLSSSGDKWEQWERVMRIIFPLLQSGNAWKCP